MHVSHPFFDRSRASARRCGIKSPARPRHHHGLARVKGPRQMERPPSQRDVLPELDSLLRRSRTHRASWRTPSLETLISTPPPREWKPRARGAHRRSGALSADRVEGSWGAAGPGTHGGLGLGIDPPTSGPGSRHHRRQRGHAQPWILPRSAGSMALGIGAAWEARCVGPGALEEGGGEIRQPLARGILRVRPPVAGRAVARAYFSAIEAAQQEANAQETLGLYQDYLKLTDVRKEQGFSSDFELAQVKSRTAGAQGHAVPRAVGAGPGHPGDRGGHQPLPCGQDSPAPLLPRPPRPVPAGLPMELLERRPDLIAAERRFAAAFHRANEATAARLPRFASAPWAGWAARTSTMWECSTRSTGVSPQA